MSVPSAGQLKETERYVGMLTASAPPESLLDVRYRARAGGFSRSFLRICDPSATRRIAVIGQHMDVYVGCAPRVRERGTREDLARTALLWADCDNPQAHAAACALAAQASMIVASGSAGHAHAYWALARPLDTEALQDANRRLAEALGADMKCADATRILRVPGTFNFKHDPPRPVELLLDTGSRHELRDILHSLPIGQRSRERTRHGVGGARRSDPLHQIEPVQYVRLLTGRTPNSEGKIACPLHPDRKPSLHAYRSPEEGWACYGCPTTDGKPRGGDIYTLASLLWGIPAQGRSFYELRARLDDVFAIQRPAARTSQFDPQRSAYRESVRGRSDDRADR